MTSTSVGGFDPHVSARTISAATVVAFRRFIATRRSIAAMGDRTSYPPGTFSWAELVTTDADSAKAFYTALLGWDYDDQPVGGDQVYSMATRDGKNVAALYTDASQPPHWNSYVTVASVDEATAKAKAAGGSELHEPFDVMDVGRMAFIADPAGAAIFLWEPRSRSAPSSSTRRAR